MAETNRDRKPAHAAVIDQKDIPNDIDAEKSVLAACLLSEDAASELVTRLTEDNFFRPAHKIIFKAIRSLAERSIAVDQISVADNLQSTGQLEAIGGRVYLLELADNTFSLTGWPRHAEIVRRLSVQRDLLYAATEIRAIAYDAPDDLAETVGEAEAALFKVTQSRVPSSFVKLDNLLSEAYEEMSEIGKAPGNMIGVPTGFADVDDLFHGWRGGELVILAARPGVGKSSFALNIAVNAAKKGTTVAFFSLEMSKNEVAQRLLSMEARVSLAKIRSGHLSPEDCNSIVDATNTLSGLSLYVDDTPGLSILEARAKARREMRKVVQEGGKGLIVLDYLQLMKPSVERKDGNRATEVGEISRGLKILAKELDMPILALSQLSRNIDQRGTKNSPLPRPMLSDLRESGAIEQDADIVMFINRIVNEKDIPEGSDETVSSATLIVAKHRNGACRDIPLTFSPDSTSFYSKATPAMEAAVGYGN